MLARSLVLVALAALVAPATSFSTPALRSPGATRGHHSVANVCPARTPRMQFAEPDAPVKIPDTFNPAEWGRGGGGGGFGEGLGGFKVPDTFNPDALERERKGSSTAVMDRPKLDPGKKYKVLLFNDEKNTREYVIDTLIKLIPGMTADKAKAVTDEAHTNGLALVGVWMFELAEAYSDMLRSAGLKSDIEEE